MESKNKNFSAARVTIVNRDSLLAMASVLVGNAMFVNGLRVLQGKNGLFVAMPSRKNAAGEYQDIAFPCSKEIREELQEYVLAEYEALLKKQPATVS